MTMSNQSKQRECKQTPPARAMRRKILLSALVLCLSSAGCASNPFMTWQSSAQSKPAAVKNETPRQWQGGPGQQRNGAKANQSAAANPAETTRDATSIAQNFCVAGLPVLAVAGGAAPIVAAPVLLRADAACELIRRHTPKGERAESLRQQEESASKKRAKGK